MKIDRFLKPAVVILATLAAIQTTASADVCGALKARESRLRTDIAGKNNIIKNLENELLSLQKDADSICQQNGESSHPCKQARKRVENKQKQIFKEQEILGVFQSSLHQICQAEQTNQCAGACTD